MVGHCDNEACSTKTYSVVDPVDRSDPVEPGQPTSSGVLSSMAPAADGNPSILYNNTEYRRGLWLARCDNGVCSSAQRSLIRSHTSFHRFDLALGTDNQPFMAVFDWSPSGTFRITAVHCDDAACSLGSESVIQAWPLGFDGWGFPSVVIGSDGLPLIAYNEIHMGEGPDPVRIEALHAAHCDDIRCDTWTSTTISKERIDFVSADTGGDGLPFIAYRTDGALKVAHCKDIACMSSEIVTVDPGPSVGSFTSLATDPFGMPTIAYFDEANHDLKVARLGP